MQPHAAGGARSCRHFARAASEAGDNAPACGAQQQAGPLPFQASQPRGGMERCFLSAQPQPWQQEGALPGGEDKCWFDPLYIEDPLRPQNNVGRNCFRISQIQQAFAQAYTELLHRGSAQASGEHRQPGSVLALMLYMA